jgi:NADH-quinone oxidoreductase subunit I
VPSLPAPPKIGLLKGLALTLKTALKPATTAQYPHVKPDLPPRTRGVIALMEENCTVCMLCARECPASTQVVGLPRSFRRVRP